MNITDTEYEILNFIKSKDPTGKGVSNMFIHGKLRELTPRVIRIALRNLTVKKMLTEKDFYFYLNRDTFRTEIVGVEKPLAQTKITLTRIIFTINDYYEKFNDYPIPSQVHSLFQEIYNTKVDFETFTRNMRKLGEEGELERIPIGNKFKYKPKGSGSWEDKPLNKFVGD
jgi:hypothetical protein